VGQWRTQRRAQRTADEYFVWIKRWRAWNIENEIDSIVTTTIRACRAWLGEVRDHSEWNAFTATRALKAWARWMVADGLVETDPIVSLPYLPEPQTSPTLPVAEIDDIATLLATCSTDSFEDVRDQALINVLADTGVRRGELVGMRWSDLDFAEATITLRHETTKGRKSRVVAVGNETIRALRLYVRKLDLLTEDDPMWIGLRGPLLSNGVGQAITKRARRAGVNLTVHSFRRGMATRWLRSRGSEVHLMRVAGWSSQRMVARYTSAVASERHGLVESRMQWKPPLSGNEDSAGDLAVALPVRVLGGDRGIG